MKFAFWMVILSFSSSLLLFSPEEDWIEKVDKALLEQAKDGKAVEFLVVLKQQPALPPTNDLHSKTAKGERVFQRLQEQSRRSQKEIRGLLQAEGVPHNAFFIVNALWVKGDAALIRRLALRPEVDRVAQNAPYSFHRPFPDPEQPRQRSEVEWGVQRIGADAVWAMGIRGQGAVVAGADTGYDWQHPALSGQYRGNSAVGVNHNYNWYDAIHEISPIHNDSIISPDLNPCGLDSGEPCDDNGHGTHTMGIMVGDDGLGNQVGVAPEATWIACRNMERGYGSPATYIECFEWFLAPTDLNGNNPDPSKAPHVINNSWGCPPFEGCNTENFDVMDKVVQTMKAAGIVVVASAGNSGRKCNTIDDPAAIFSATFTVGATKSNDSIAVFSSRGPVAVDSSYRMKPDIAAPGQGVRSAVPDSSYASFSGTSMAGPHVAGVVALMISANPQLAGEVDLIEQIIKETAVPMADTVGCGDAFAGAVPNNTYGYGRIDALAAVMRATELTDINPPAGRSRAFLYPNPAGSTVRLVLEGMTGEVQLDLFDAAGRRVHNRRLQISNARQEEQLVVASLLPGVYFYRLSGKSGTWSGKLIVE